MYYMVLYKKVSLLFKKLTILFVILCYKYIAPRVSPSEHGIFPINFKFKLLINRFPTTTLPT